MITRFALAGLLALVIAGCGSAAVQIDRDSITVRSQDGKSATIPIENVTFDGLENLPTPTPGGISGPTTPTTPSPTPSTPRPGPTPAATPTGPAPTLLQGIATAEPGMVKLTAGGNQWTGVMINSAGKIITTSTNLGQAPVAGFTTQGGATGQAWVIGRDDDFDMALLEVVNASQTYDTISMEDRAVPQVGKQLASMHYGLAGTLSKQSTSVVGSRQDLNTGLQFLQMRGLNIAGSEGGAFVDEYGRLRGVRLEEQYMIELGIGRTGEIYAMTTSGLLNRVLPLLEGGVTVISGAAAKCPAGVFPPIPATFNGSVTIGGEAAPVGSRVYAKISKRGLADQWFSGEITTAGRYLLTVGVCQSSYVNATVQFWMNGSASPNTSTYAAARTTPVNLTFSSTVDPVATPSADPSA